MKINFSKLHLVSGIILICILLFNSYLNLSHVNADAKFNGAKRIGGPAADYAYSVIVNSTNQRLVSGFVIGDADFNSDGDRLDTGESGIGYGGYDAYISVYDNSERHLWSKRFGGIGNDAAYKVYADENRIILTGTVTGDVDFNSDGDKLDSGESSIGFSDTDGYIVVYDINGNYISSKRFGGTGKDVGYDVIVNNNQILINGIITGNVDFNNDGDKVDAGESAIGYGGEDGFIVSYNLVGDFLWAKRLGSTGLDGFRNMANSNENIVAAGYITGDVDFNGDGDKLDQGESGVGYGITDAYITILDTNGNHIFSKRFGGINNDIAIDLSVDNNNRIIIVGFTSGDVDFNGDGDTLDVGESAIGFGGIDIFINTLDFSGNYLWSKRLGGTGSESVSSVYIDTNNRIVLAGYVSGNTDFNGDGDSLDPGESAVGYGGNDGFIVAFDSSGNYIWSRRLGGINGDMALGLFVKSTGEILVSGFVNGDGDFNGDGDLLDSGESSIGYGVQDAFYAVFSTDYLPPVLTLPASLVTNDTTPTINFTIDAPASCRLSLTNESYDNMADDVICSGAGTTSASCTTPDLGADGIKNVYLSCIDEYNNKSNPVAYQITIDTAVLPARITDIGLITNVPDSENLYYYFTSQTPIIKGTAEAYATVTFKSGSQIYSTIVDANGRFEITISNPSLIRGTNVLEYYVTDLAGNISTVRTLTLVIGEENFPSWLLPDNVQVSELTPADLNQQNEMQEEIKEEIQQLPVTGNTITEIQILNPDGTPLKNQQVTLDGVIYTTDANGYIYVKNLKAGKYSIEVKLDDKVLKQEFEITAKQLKDGTTVILKHAKTNFLIWLCLIPIIIVIILILFYLKKRKSNSDHR